MRLCHKVLLGTLCGGVLLVGIGTGVAFGEFSSLEYAGQRTLGEVQMETMELEEQIDPGKGIWHVNIPCPGDYEPEIKEDETIPENTVRFIVSYNKDRVTPRLHAFVDSYTYWGGDGEYTQEQNPILELYCSWKEQDEMKLFMELKDDFLANLKEGKIASYQGSSYVETVEVRINPANEDDIFLY